MVVDEIDSCIKSWSDMKNCAIAGMNVVYRTDAGYVCHDFCD